MKACVFINFKAGNIPPGSGLIDRIDALFRSSLIPARIVQLPDEKNHQAVLQAETVRGADLLVAAGGDGTISTVAETCVRRGITLGVLPLGTFNHFARDAGLPTDLQMAVECIRNGRRTRVDVGEVNQRIFINNSSIGAYPHAVEERDQILSHVPVRRRAAMVAAVVRVFSRRPLLSTEIELDGAVVRRATPFVFVGNNEYSVSRFSYRFRSTLNGGKLCVYTTRCTGLAGFIKLLCLALVDRLDQSRDFEITLVDRLRIYLPRSSIKVSRDGEVERMELPLDYQIRKQALELIVP